MYKELISPILDHLDSETWHKNAVEALHLAESNSLTMALLEKFAYKGKRFTHHKLNTTLGGVQYDNPVMVGAGWDKHGRSLRGLYQLGFSSIELGSVTAMPQPGNPKPRQFNLNSGVFLNRLGFNSVGMDAVAQNLERYQNDKFPIAISIGKNKEVSEQDAPEAHAKVVRKLYSHASYFAINVSSPNTPGLRDLQDKKPLTDIVQAVNEAMDSEGRRKPVYIKIAPDLENNAVDDLIDVVLANKLDGIIATNTTNNSQIKAKYGESWANEAGGLSGDDADYRRMSTEKIAHIYKQTIDKQKSGDFEIIGVGAVKDMPTALEKIKAGAKMLQVVTGIRGEGLSLPGRINRDLVEYMDSYGIKNIQELVGLSA